jgi:hypothetical protein
MQTQKARVERFALKEIGKRMGDTIGPIETSSGEESENESPDEQDELPGQRGLSEEITRQPTSRPAILATRSKSRRRFHGRWYGATD